MKIKAGLCGALLLLATATAYGLGVQSGQTEAPVPASSVNSISDAMASQVAERARVYVGSIGVDPGSENGRLLVQWLTKVALVPQNRANLNAYAAGRSPFRTDMLSPENRLKVLRLIKEIASGPRNSCTMPQAQANDLGGMAKAMSPKEFRSALEVMEIIVTQRAGQTGAEEHYTVAELLDADARLDALELPDSLSKGREAEPCAAFLFMIDAVDAMPEPQRQRTTYEFFKMMNGGAQATESVLGDPVAYLDDVFDERRLPDSIRRHLPPDGSRPLPFSRLIVDAERVNKAAPESEGPVTDTYVNRRNNGVVAELVTSPDRSGKAKWASFVLTFGIVDLSSQGIWNGATMLSTLKDDTAIAIANQPIMTGKRIEMPVPQPSSKGQLSRRCEVGKTAPASSIFRTLTGDAVDFDCSELRKDGTTTRVRAVWLANYGITLPTAYDDEDGRTDVVIKNVTIVTP
ncbi:hypothetical protein [Burkholderia stagnalis]|nr:hypothetical protein [Burkholderia stagnalis]